MVRRSKVGLSSIWGWRAPLCSSRGGEGAAGVCGEEVSGGWASVASGGSVGDCLQNGLFYTWTLYRFRLTEDSGRPCQVLPRATPRLPCRGRLPLARRLLCWANDMYWCVVTSGRPRFIQISFVFPALLFSPQAPPGRTRVVTSQAPGRVGCTVSLLTRPSGCRAE